MPLFDPDTGEYTSTSYGLDTHAAVAGDNSLFSDAQNLLTKGAPLTGLAIANSFANTAIELTNWATGSDTEKWSVEKEVGQGDMNDYYNEHSTSIETAGLLVGSFLPGTIAIKALKLAQAGRMTETLAAATNIFAGPKAAVIEGAKAEVAAGNTGLFGSLAAEKTKAIALGFGDQALQAIAFQTATAATMKASPLLDDQGLADVAENMLYGTIIGAGIGGLIGGIGEVTQLNKVLRMADVASKQAETIAYLGKGNYFAGDQAAVIVNSFDKVQEAGAAGGLAGKKASFALDNAKLQFKKQVSTLNPTDTDATSAFSDALLDLKAKGGLGGEQAYSYLARLDKVTRAVDADLPEYAGEGIFYVNTLSKSQNPGLQDLMSTAPNSNATLSRAYQLRGGATKVNIAHAAEQVELPDGTTSPAYIRVQDAWDAGKDFFIDKRLQVHVNPDAPNIEGRVSRPGESRVLTRAEEQEYRSTGKLPAGSAPLRTAPVFFNTESKSLSTEFTPVVGDYGKPQLTATGLQYGSKFSAQAVADGADFTGAEIASTEDANIRYVWAAKRGIKGGDIIHPNDVPMLDQLYRQVTTTGAGYADNIAKLTAKGVQIDGTDALPATAGDLANLIRTAKDQLIHDTIASNPELKVTDVALRAGVPESYIANGFKAQSVDDFVVSNPEKWEKVNTVNLQYNIGNVNTNDGMVLSGLVDLNYRIGLVRSANQDQAARLFGSTPGFTLSEFTADGYSAADAIIEGVGHKFLTFSNANYLTLGARMEAIGAAVSRFLPKRISEVTSVLQPAANAMRANPEIAAKVGAFEAVKQRTGELFRFLSPELENKYLRPAGAAADWAPSGNVAVLKNSLVFDKAGNVVDWNRAFLPKDFFPGVARTDRAGTVAEDTGKLYTYYDLHPAVGDWNRANQQINDNRITLRNGFRQSTGLPVKVQPGDLYPAPIDTSQHSHFAYLRTKPGMAMSDDGVAVITAKSAQELQEKISLLNDRYSVYYKDDLKLHHQVEGDYEYNRNFAQSQVNSDLARAGVLNNVFPETRADNIIKKYVDWHSKQERLLVNDHVELANAQLFEELKQMGSRFDTEKSQTGVVSKLLGRQADNPYQSYIRTALNLSAKDQYRLWTDATEKVEAFADTAFRFARNAFTSAKNGVIPWEEANKIMTEHGLGQPYGAGISALRAYYDVANALPEPRILDKFVRVANAVMGASVIRLDFFQQAIHWMSTPVLMSAEAQSAIRQAKDFITTELPDGSGRMIPSVTKAMSGALSGIFSNPEVKETWLPLYQRLGIVRNKSSEFSIDGYYGLINKLMPPLGKISESAMAQKIHDLVETGAKFTGSNFTEQMLHFWTAETGRAIFEGAGLQGQKLIDSIRTFTNRVEGNYIASHRPVAFQGPIGAALSLFQTYQFNLLQQVFRYVGDGDTKAVATLAGMQSTFFGIQGLPGFQMINNHLVGQARGNPSHSDIYSTVNDLAGKKLGDYLLYGVASNWMNAGLYSRGDINPRRLSVLPLNPLDYSAISGGIKFVGNLLDVGGKIAQGGSIPASLMMGLEHNGLSRPLQGLAQIMQGFVTTADGGLIARTSQPTDGTQGGSDMFSMANFSRLLGARPLDEAIALDARFRDSAYRAKDQQRIADLGAAVKSNLIGGGVLAPEEIDNFAAKYAASGGNIQNFGRTMMEWTSQTKVSVANKIFRQLGSDRNKSLMIQMGGLPLPDYSTSGSSTAAAATNQ